MMGMEVSEASRAEAALINNMGLEAARTRGDGLYAGIAMLRRAVALNPSDFGHRLNLATFLLEVGEDDEAESLATSSLKEDNSLANGWQILGVVNTNRGRMLEAIDCFKRALECDPLSDQRKFDLSAAYMRTGDFTNGLPWYEARYGIIGKVATPPNAPPWTGQKTGHLIVWPDQGHGDVFMFSRFLPWARKFCDKLTFVVTPHILPLFAGYSDIAELVVIYSLEPGIYDHQISVASLPLLYGLTPDNIPPDPGYLRAAPGNGTLGGRGLKIGIAWQGNPLFPGDRLRSIPFREFLPIAADPRNTVISLQVGLANQDIFKARAARLVRDMSADVEGEWSHTATVMKHLDLVVSSCTAIPHLAGALGIPTFVMLPLFADWRWLHGRDDSPWYPNTRLFRQTKVGDWSSVVARVIKAINVMHNQRAQAQMLSAPMKTFDPNLPGTADQKEPDVAGVLRKVLRPGDTFIDVGANAGMHTVLAAELVGDTGKVLAFEPGENVLPELRKAVDGKANVEVIAQPLWCKSGEEIDFHLCADGSGGNAVWDPGKFPTNEKTRANRQVSKMLTTTLDRACHGLSPRAIKIDTEGAEQRVLEGAAGVLFEKRPPFVIAEWHEFGLHELGCSLASLRALMAKAGYQTFILFSDGSRPKLLPLDQTLKCPTEFIINLLFSTEAEVKALWTDEPSETATRPLLVFGKSADIGKMASGFSVAPILESAA